MPESTSIIGATIGQEWGIALVCALLLLFGVLFNYVVTALHRRGLNEGYTWLEVVIGVAVVLFAAVPVLGLEDVLLLLLLFAAAGLPMAAGDIARYVQAKRAFERRQKDGR